MALINAGEISVHKTRVKVRPAAVVREAAEVRNVVERFAASQFVGQTGALEAPAP